MWEINSIDPDPFLASSAEGRTRPTTLTATTATPSGSCSASYILSASTTIDSFLGKAATAAEATEAATEAVGGGAIPSVRSSFREEEEGRGARVALADFAARRFLRCQRHETDESETETDTATVSTTIVESEPCEHDGDKSTIDDGGDATNADCTDDTTCIVRLETLDEALCEYSSSNNNNNSGTKRRRRGGNKKRPIRGGRRRTRKNHPYVVERSDFFCSGSNSNSNNNNIGSNGCESGDGNNNNYRLYVTVRVRVDAITTTATSTPNNNRDDTTNDNDNDTNDNDNAPLASAILPGDSLLESSCSKILRSVFPTDDPVFSKSLLGHVACVVLQQKLRSRLSSLSAAPGRHGTDGGDTGNGGGAIAFVADGSVLPRKSGASAAPMASPPAVPFRAPAGSGMTVATLRVCVGPVWIGHVLGNNNDDNNHNHGGIAGIERETNTVVLSGLLVPGGVTLICGGGYHGKSTLLQAIAVGHYDKIPGDGREFCVSISDALMVRAEDGRYVNNCNISAFVSNLPTPPGVQTALDTKHFSTRDSSGSTSQATNVAEAIELGARAILVDEDISAANFMARDGRMRALVMDESITPLLYRVNGLYNTHGISTLIVVGGVGDWLDVPHNVVLLDKYVASDATAKARSISRQFSYGHVEYAGRGVVHRLEWEPSGTPKLRRPTDAFSGRFDSDVVVSLSEGGRGLVLYKDCGDSVINHSNDSDGDDYDEEEGCIDASRLQQLLGKKQLVAVGLCIAWILQSAPNHAEAGLNELLKLLDSVLDRGGMNRLVTELKEARSSSLPLLREEVLGSVGYLERPRGFEVGQALARMRGIRFEDVPVPIDPAEEAARIAEENRKKALAALWANRRSKQRSNA